MTETMELFDLAVNDATKGPQDLTESLLRRLAEKGLTLEQCADPRMMNQPIKALQRHCRKYGISFPDYDPASEAEDE